MMEVFLELAYSALLTLLFLHVFGKLVTSFSGFGAAAKLAGGKLGFQARGSDTVVGGGTPPPDCFAAEEPSGGARSSSLEGPEGDEARCSGERLEFRESPEKEEEETAYSEGKLVGREIEERSDEDEGDGDWVGIERTELERLFGSAMAFVGSASKCDRVSVLGSDVKTKLYGLHKIATQGPCSEPRPMALKVSARAKWNAWQQLGEMTPEMAMEKYVSLLSESVPLWMEDEFKGDGKQVSGSERKREEIKPCH